MPFKTPCFCGASEKTFKMNIGPNYHDTCCEEAGYDHQGKRAVGFQFEDGQVPEGFVVVEAENPVVLKIEQVQPTLNPKLLDPTAQLSKSKIKDLSSADLRALASSRGIDPVQMTRVQIMDRLLGRV